jgi:co-chaperonin GroES (HSP10)
VSTLLSALQAAEIRKRAEEVETYWKPKHPRTLIAVEMPGSGVQNGIHVVEASDRYKLMAIVMVTNGCQDVKPGDTILFEEGCAEPIKTLSGEEFVVIREDMVTDILEGYSFELEAP